MTQAFVDLLRPALSLAFVVGCVFVLIVVVAMYRHSVQWLKDERTRRLFMGNRCAGSPVPPFHPGAAVDPALRDAPSPRTPARPAPSDGDAA